MASGGSGKTIAGCSGCLVLVFLTLTLVFSFFAAPISTALIDLMASEDPETAVLIAGIVGNGQLATSTCCCLSGFLMLIGIVMLLLGGKGDD